MLLHCYYFICHHGPQKNSATGWCLPSPTSPAPLLGLRKCFRSNLFWTWYPGSDFGHLNISVDLICDMRCLRAEHLANCCVCADKWLLDYNPAGHIHAIFNLASTGNSKNALGTDPLCASNCSTVPGPQRVCTVHAQVCAATSSQLSLPLCYHAIICLGRCNIQNETEKED